MAHLAQAPTLLDLIPGARAGVSYLLGQVANFQRIPLRLAAAEQKAVTAKRAAESRQDMGTATRAALVLNTIAGIRNTQTSVGIQLADVLDQLRKTGLAQTPIELGLAAAKAAANVAALFSATSDVEKSANNLASATGTGGGVVSALTEGSPLVRYLVIGGAAYLGFWALSRGGSSKKW